MIYMHQPAMQKDATQQPAMRQTETQRQEPGGRVFGYARVSTRDQNLSRQLDALENWGVPSDAVFADKASGRDFERTEWRRLMGTIAAGDVLVVLSIDRLGRNYDEILAVWHRLTREVGVDIVVLDMPLLDTRAGRSGEVTGRFISDIVLQLLSYVAQIERENIKARQAEGIASAKVRGVRFGRPRKKQPHAYEAIRADVLAGRITRAAAAERCGVSISTLSRWLREDKAHPTAPESSSEAQRRA